MDNLASGPGPSCTTEGHAETRTPLVAANGDQITLLTTAYNCTTGPTTQTAMDSYVVTGGTGKFSGASGSGTITATIDLANGTAMTTFTGTLSEDKGMTSAVPVTDSGAIDESADEPHSRSLIRP